MGTRTKYKMTDEIIKVNGQTLHRIEALIDIPYAKVNAGDKGGFIESEENLSQEGNCWVGDDGQVSEDAQVYDNAWVSGNAWVFGNAQVFGDAQVLEGAHVFGGAQVSGRAKVDRKSTRLNSSHTS